MTLVPLFIMVALACAGPYRGPDIDDTSNAKAKPESDVSVASISKANDLSRPK